MQLLKLATVPGTVVRKHDTPGYESIRLPSKKEFVDRYRKEWPNRTNKCAMSDYDAYRIATLRALAAKLAEAMLDTKDVCLPERIIFKDGAVLSVRFVRHQRPR